MHHQLGGSTEDNMNKMSVIGHFFLIFMYDYQLIALLLVLWTQPGDKTFEYGGQTKKEKKGLLDIFLFNGPPN